MRGQLGGLERVHLANAVDRRARTAEVVSLRSSDLLANLDAAEADRALARLRTMLATRDSGQGIWFDSRAWIVGP